MAWLEIEETTFATGEVHETDRYLVDSFKEATRELVADLRETSSEKFRNEVMALWAKNQGAEFHVRNGISSAGVRIRYVP